MMTEVVVVLGMSAVAVVKIVVAVKAEAHHPVRENRLL
jgi:hypothetical protein